MSGLASAIRAASALGESSDDERPFLAVEAAELLESALAAPDVLNLATARLVALATKLGCDRVLGASPVGERLAGAMVAVAANGLRDYSAGARDRAVLVVDSAFITGIQVLTAARRARMDGAASVSAAVLADLSEEPIDLRPALDSVQVVPSLA